MNRMPRPGDIYRDLNEELYRVVTLAEHADSKEKLVVYQALDGRMQVYALPVSAFADKSAPEGDAGGRFALVPAVGVETADSDGSGECQKQPVLESAHGPSQEGSVRTVQSGQEAEGEVQEEFELDPRLLAFLEADSYEKKLEIYASLAGRADEAMLNTIAVSLDLELSGDTLEDQYSNLKSCLLMLEKYECNRLR